MVKTKTLEYKVKKGPRRIDDKNDMIPVSIALAQAAKESGWGTSRFALREMQSLDNGLGMDKACSFK